MTAMIVCGCKGTVNAKQSVHTLGRYILWTVQSLQSSDISHVFNYISSNVDISQSHCYSVIWHDIFYNILICCH